MTFLLQIPRGGITGSEDPAFVRLGVQNDKLLSRNFVPIYAPRSSTKECPAHSSIPSLNIFIKKKIPFRCKVKGGRFLFSLIYISWFSRGRSVWQGYCRSSFLFLWIVCSIVFAIFLLKLQFFQSICTNSLYHICCKYFHCSLSLNIVILFDIQRL